jgi:hypothetical protein
VEAKFSDTGVSPNWGKFAALLPCRRGLQVVRGPFWKAHRFGEAEVLVAGAAEALFYFA